MNEAGIRPPVVAIMGHVDHGKTTLLDYIRKTNVVNREYGGITQHLGAYQFVNEQGKRITFLDTPGHAAFENIRRRGGEVADIVVLVVAVDDGVMRQTVEAINHVKKSGAQMIVAFNKVDLPDVNIDKAKQQLAEEGILVESYGGSVVDVEISAKAGKNIDSLLEMIFLVAEMMELKNKVAEPVVAICLESKMDKGGPMTNILIKRGCLRRGMPVEIEGEKGVVRSIVNDRGERVEELVPSGVGEVLGFPTTVKPGSLFMEQNNILVNTEQVGALMVRDVAMTASEAADGFFKKDQKKMPVMLRADVGSSLEAILENIVNREQLQILDGAVGEISEKDVEYADENGAMIFGFNVKVAKGVLKRAEGLGVKIYNERIIYKLMEELETELVSYFSETSNVVIMARAKVLKTFEASSGLQIAGVEVEEGVLNVGARVRQMRGGQQLAEGVVKSARHVKEDVKRLNKGSEGGVVIESDRGSLIYEEGDIIEAYRRK